MAQKIDLTVNDSGSSTVPAIPTIGELLEDIVTNVDIIRNNMKGGGLGVKSVDSFGNSTDGTFQQGDGYDDKLEELAAASEKLPVCKGKLLNKLGPTESGGLGLAPANATLETLAQAVEDIDKHDCKSFATATDDYGEYIPLNLGEAFSIPKGYHTGTRIIAVDDDECENADHLNIGATRYTAPLPGDNSLVINNTEVNAIDGDGNYIYDSPYHIKQTGYYGLTTVTIDPPDLQSIADQTGKTLATASDVLKDSWFVGAEGMTKGTLEYGTCEIESSDLPAPGSAVKTVSAPENIAYKEVKINPIPSHYLDISDGGKPVNETVNLSEMKGHVELKMDSPAYVRSINININNDIYGILCSI
jgi:hypothetical protein